MPVRSQGADLLCSPIAENWSWLTSPPWWFCSAVMLVSRDWLIVFTPEKQCKMMFRSNTHTHTHIKSLKIMIPLKSIFYCNTGRRIFFNRACLPCHKECYVAGKDDENKLSKVRGQPQVSKYDVPRACLWNQSTNRDELSTRNPCTNISKLLWQMTGNQ
jgi:hypothetical protein